MQCVNYFVLTCHDATEFREFIDQELGDDRGDEGITVVQRGAKGIKFNQVTIGAPDFAWLHSLITNYPNCWIKNEWIEEGGMAGVWVGSVNGIRSLTWEDLSLEAQHDIFQPMQPQN